MSKGFAAVRRRHDRYGRLPFGLVFTVAFCVIVAMHPTAWALPRAPEGRAYEMVSPPEKGGLEVEAGSEQRAMSSGQGIAYKAQGSFAGCPSNLVPNIYIGTRQFPSWSSLCLSPPVDTTVISGAGGVRAVSEDHSKAIVESNLNLAPDGWATPSLTLFGAAMYLRDVTTNSYETVTPVPLTLGSPPCEVCYPSRYAIGTEDFGHVLFETTAELTADAVGVAGTKLYEKAGGALRLVSLLPGDIPSPGSAAGAAAAQNERNENAISRDGSTIFFTSPTSETTGRLYRRTDQGTVLVSEEENSLIVDPPNAAIFRGATPNGSKVLFTSLRQLVDQDTNSTSTGGNPPAGRDLYMYTHSANPATDSNLTLISKLGTGNAGGAVQGLVGLSEDGTKVYFVSNTQLVTGAPAVSGPKLFVWDAGVVKYIAALPNVQNFWGITAQAQQHRYATPDGEHFLFNTTAALTPEANGTGRKVYLYSAESSTNIAPDLVCISCDPTGDPTDGEATPFRGGLQRYVSDDGSRAFFDTTSALVPGDTNGQADVYMWEDNAVHLITTGQSSAESRFADASASGDDVFFVTRERLVGWDRDDVADLYDARIGGGLPEPPAAAVPCVGDQCQGPPSGRPFLADPASPAYQGVGDAEAGPRGQLTVRRLSRRERSRLARTGRATVRVRVNRGGKVSLTARARIAGATRTVARDSASPERAGTVRLTLKLTRAARRHLARRGRLRLVIGLRLAGVREAQHIAVRLTRGGEGR